MVKQRRKIKSKQIYVKELLELIPDDLIDDLAEKIMVDKYVKKLKANGFFKLIMFSLLSSERLSLRVMETNFSEPYFRSLATSLEAEDIGWTGIRDRLIHVKSSFFKALFDAVYKRVSELYSTQSMKRYHIKRYDSTMIATFSHLLAGMRVGNTTKNKTQVKITAEFTNDFLIQADFHKDQKHLSEETSLKERILKSSPIEVYPSSEYEDQLTDIHVFDNGLKSRKTFDLFCENDLKAFVTRLQRKPRYQLLFPFWEDDGFQDTDELEFIQDSVVRLYKSGHKLHDRLFRLIQYRSKENEKTLTFLTNIGELPATEIASAYRLRWDIEVLFRFLKQEMNLTHFVCNDQNAIEVMLYCTYIASMLVLIYKKLNGINSYKKAKKLFFSELNKHILLEILRNPNDSEQLKQYLEKHFYKKGEP